MRYRGVLSLNNSFNHIGLDHVFLVRVASTAVATALLGGDKDSIINAVSNAFLDGGCLRTYRHGAQTGWRKSWAAGDATARAVRLALMAVSGEMGYPNALTAPGWGLQDVLFDGRRVEFGRPLDTYVVENILFKASHPAEYHAQSAAECAIALHPQVCERLDAVAQIVLTTQAQAMRIIDKPGPLRNPADRDHCLQYIVAIGLLFGELKSVHYSDEIASDPRIDVLRSKMQVRENVEYSLSYLEENKRSIGNGVCVRFENGDVIEMAIEYPLGHPRRRAEALPLLINKFKSGLELYYPSDKIEQLCTLFQDSERLSAMEVTTFMELWALN